MGSKHKEELTAELQRALVAHLCENSLVIARHDDKGDFVETQRGAESLLLERAGGVVAKLMADWSVEKGSPSSHDHPLYDGPDMVRFKIRTKPRELNEAELAEKAARSAHYDWIWGKDHSTPPPESVQFIDLLRQTVWFDSKTKLADMTPGERLRSRKFLLANAGKIHHVAAIRFAGCPDDGLVEQFLDEDPKQWIAGEPLFQQLEELIKLDEKRPCDFRWGDQEGVGDEPCAMSGDYRHQCGRKRDHKKPHRCRVCQNERGRTVQDTPPPADAKMSDLLDQNVWWVTRKGEQIKLDDMEPSHRANTLAYLQRNARKIVDGAYGGYMADAPEHVQRAFEQGDPWVTLSESPLVSRLSVLVSGDIQDGVR